MIITRHYIIIFLIISNGYVFYGSLTSLMIYLIIFSF